MYWNSSEKWHGHRHGGSWWIAPLVIFGLIILTHGWIIILPLMLLAGFALVAFVLPRIMSHMHQGEWGSEEWWSHWDEKRKRHFQHWDDRRYDEKPKHDNPDHIEYV